MSKPPLSLPEFVVLFALIMSLTALSIDAMLPALPQIGQTLAVADSRDTQLIVSMLVFGMVFGELLFGPLADAIGRKRAILTGMAIFCAGTICAMTAQSIGQMLLGRIIQGIGVAGPKIGSRALIRDQYEGDAMARVMSFVMMCLILVPMLAPAYGQLILAIAGWRTIFVSFLALAAVLAVWLSVRQPETLTSERRIPLSIKTILRSTLLILKHPKVMAYTVTAGLTFGALLIYLSTAQAIFQELYQSGDRFPLYFAILALGAGIASLINSQLVMRLGMQRLTISALIGLISASGALLAAALLHAGIPPFRWFMGLCFLIFFCVGIVFGNISAMAMQSLGRIAGLGASLIASVSSVVAVVVSVLVGRFYDSTVVPMAAGFMICAVIALVLVLLARNSRAGAV